MIDIDIIAIKTETLSENNLKAFCYLNVSKTVDNKLYYLAAVFDIQYQIQDIIWSLKEFKWCHYAVSDIDWVEGMPIENFLDYQDDSDIKTEEIVKIMANEEIIARILGESGYFDKDKQ